MRGHHLTLTPPNTCARLFRKATMELVAKSNTKLIVWRYFGCEPGVNGQPENPDNPKCRLCFEKGVSKSIYIKGGNTSNLFSHLCFHHPKEFAIVQEAKTTGKLSREKISGSKQVTIADVSKYPRSRKRWQSVTDAVTVCLAKDMLPMHIVEKDGFRRMIEVLDSRYDLPHRKYFSQTAIPKLYSRVRDTVVAELCKVEFFSATTDLWSSHTMEPYLSLTIHYIDEEWTQRSLCLQTMFMPQDHTGENIAEALSEALQQWKLPQCNLVSITTDNGTNVIAAMDILGWKRLSCFGHNLHLAVTNSVKGDHRISRAVGVCKKLVVCFAHSWKKKRELAEVQEELKLPKHSLITVSYY